jgi:hypothetical protein
MNPAPDPTLVREAALAGGVCERPIISRVTDLAAGETRLVPIACGAMRDVRCPPCAVRANKLRTQQCREGWYVEAEPICAPTRVATTKAGATTTRARPERVRSTRRRPDRRPPWRGDGISSPPRAGGG